MAQEDESDPGMGEDDNPEAGLEDELERQAQYAAKQFEAAMASIGVKPPFKLDGPTYRVYEAESPQFQKPQVITFSVASGTRLTPTRNFRVGSDITYRVVEFDAVRVGDWPQIPKVDESAGPLIHREVNPRAGNVKNPDGLFHYRISGKYIYVLDTPKADTANVSVPLKPNLDYSANINAPDAVTSNDQDATIAPA